jgi:D-psicose/D-tagatose/L-ribulose 3-epimerase
LNPIGVCTWLWTSPLTDGDVGLVARAKELGADVLELCIEDTEHVSPAVFRSAAEEVGMEFSICGAFGPERDLSHEDADVRRFGLDYVRHCVDVAAEIGATNVVGPLYSAVGKTRLLSLAERERQRAMAVESIRESADYAASKGVHLAVEALNRFETDLVNTTEQALDLVERIGRDNVGILLDTFHMNVEDKSLGESIRRTGDRLFHFHACENDRGTPGTGHVPWQEVFQALLDIRYEGPVVVESFTPDVRDIAKAASIWRQLDASGDELARRSVEFVRAGMQAASAASIV